MGSHLREQFGHAFVDNSKDSVLIRTGLCDAGAIQRALVRRESNHQDLVDRTFGRFTRQMSYCRLVDGFLLYVDT